MSRLARYVIACVLTVLMLVIARLNSRGQPDHLTHEQSGIRFEIVTVPKGTEHESSRLYVSITGDLAPDDAKLIRWAVKGEPNAADPRSFYRTPLIPTDTMPDLYYADMEAGVKGGRTLYFFEVTSNVDAPRATFFQPDGSPFAFRYIGEVPSAILIGHIGFIFATFFLVALASLSAIDVLRQQTGLSAMASANWWALVCCFIGGYPLGFLMNWYAFGGIWEGVPFGTDATDNKTQLLLVYLILVTLLTLGTLTKGRCGSDRYSRKGRGWFGLGAFFVMLAIYLIPHSIQFSAGLTYAVCYGFIALCALLYLLGRKQPAVTTP